MTARDTLPEKTNPDGLRVVKCDHQGWIVMRDAWPCEGCLMPGGPVAAFSTFSDMLAWLGRLNPERKTPAEIVAEAMRVP